MVAAFGTALHVTGTDPRRSRPALRRSAPTRAMPGSRRRPRSRTSSSTPSRASARTADDRQPFLDNALPRGAGEGIHPDAARRLTFAMMVGIPIMQLIMFGYASIPIRVPCRRGRGRRQRHVRALDRAGAREHHLFPRRRLAGQRRARRRDDRAWRRAVRRRHSTDFSRRLQRGEKPALLIEADATIRSPRATRWRPSPAQPDRADPTTSRGRCAHCSRRPPFEVRIHAATTGGRHEYNIVPGLMGTILTMTLAMLTRSPSRASSSAAPWRTCWRRRCGRSR